LAKAVIFCSISEAIKDHPELRKYLGTVIPAADNYYACLNAAVFSGWLVCLHPQRHQMPDGAVVYFINAENTGQFEHADHRRRGSYVCPTLRAAQR
jgi:Fe-S cluster assembly protein SufB